MTGTVVQFSIDGRLSTSVGSGQVVKENANAISARGGARGVILPESLTANLAPGRHNAVRNCSVQISTGILPADTIRPLKP